MTNAEQQDGSQQGAGSRSHGAFDLQALGRSFPDHADTLLLDKRLTDEAATSARVFRVYDVVPAHFHRTCDEYLLVLSGRGMFFMGEDEPFEVSAGQMLFFRRGTVHGMREILAHPLTMASVDTPRRDPHDIVFVNPEDGSPESFIATRS